MYIYAFCRMKTYLRSYDYRYIYQAVMICNPGLFIGKMFWKICKDQNNVPEIICSILARQYYRWIELLFSLLLSRKMNSEITITGVCMFFQQNLPFFFLFALYFCETIKLDKSFWKNKPFGSLT